MLTSSDLLEYLIGITENSIECITVELKKVDDSNYSYEERKIAEGRLFQLKVYLDIFNIINYTDDSLRIKHWKVENDKC